LQRGLLKGLTVQEHGPFAREALQNEPILGKADLQLLRLYVPTLQDEIVALVRTDQEDIPRQRVGHPRLLSPQLEQQSLSNAFLFVLFLHRNPRTLTARCVSLISFRSSPEDLSPPGVFDPTRQARG